MGKESFFDKLGFLPLRIIASLGWRLFLFGSRMTQEEYWESIYKQEAGRFN